MQFSSVGNVGVPQLICALHFSEDQRLAQFQTKATQTTELVSLHTERAGVTGEISRLTGISTRLHAEAAAGASLLDELAKVAHAETNEMRAWADSGCKGAAPTSKLTEREAIAGKIASANASSAAAREAVGDIDEQIKLLTDRVKTIDQVIDNAALDTLQAEFAELNGEHVAAVEQVRRLSAKLHGLCSYLGSEGRRHLDRGEQAKGSSLLTRSEKLSTIKLASTGVTQGEIIEAASDWNRRAAALRNGAAS